MEFDVGKLRRGEWIVGISAALLFLLMFFDWYHVDVTGTGPGVSRSASAGGGSAWQAFGFIDVYLLLTVIVALTLVALTATQRTPALPVTASVIATAVSAVAAVLVLYRLIDTPGGGSESFGGITVNVDVSPTLWAFLGFLAVVAITYGGYLSMRDEGTSLSDVRDQARSGFDSGASPREGGPAASPPPPPPPSTPPPASAPPAPPAAPDPPSSPPPPPPSEPPPAGT